MFLLQPSHHRCTFRCPISLVLVKLHLFQFVSLLLDLFHQSNLYEDMPEVAAVI
jgi:hypothetical protein